MRARLVLPALAAATFLLFLASLCFGPAPIPWRAALAALAPHSGGDYGLIVRELRLPRALLALGIGATLGLAGAVLQGLLRNPLAEPGVIGVSTLAALGAVLAFYSGAAAVFPLALPCGGIVGALLAALVLSLLMRRHTGTLGLILAGVAINSFGGALTALALNLAPNPYAAYEVFFWLMGSLADRSMSHVWLVLPFMTLGAGMLAWAARDLDVLALGEEAAQSLGLDLPRLRLLVVVGTALAVGSGVAVAGVIGFVGLVVPHLLRPVTGHAPSRLAPASALGGAALTLAADVCTRLVVVNAELKLGVVTALVGAPFFLYLVVRTREGWAWR